MIVICLVLILATHGFIYDPQSNSCSYTPHKKSIQSMIRKVNVAIVTGVCVSLSLYVWAVVLIEKALLVPIYNSFPLKLCRSTCKIHRRSWHGITTPFLTFCLHIYFRQTFLYFFIISSLFPYFKLIVSIFIQSYVNSNLHVSTLYIIIIILYIGSKHVYLPTIFN